MHADVLGDQRRTYRIDGGAVETVTTLAWAVAVTVVPVAFHLAGQWAGILACVLLTLILSCVATRALPTALVFSWIFQSLVVSFVSPHIDEADLTTIRAYSFLTTAVAWIVVIVGYWLDRQPVPSDLRLLMRATTASLIVIALYTVIGMATDPSSAVIYLRSLAAPFFLFQIFLLVGYRQRLSLTSSLLVVGVAIVAYGYAELLVHEPLFSLVNGDHYMNLRVRQEYEAGAWLKELHESGRVMRSYLDTLVINLFNTSLLSDLQIQIYRLVGPNFHPISFAYALTFFTLVAVATGNRWFLVLSAPLLFVIGSKGSIILTVFVIMLLGLRRIVSLSTVVYACLVGLLVYAIAGVAIGIQTQDYHVIGLIGGLNGFVKNPIGHGIGVGGNLSMNMAATIDWSRSQNLGQTDVAVESAVGVLLYQMGVAAAFVFLTMLLIASRLLRIAAAPAAKPALMCALAILTIGVNGLFQEEALFAPLALALMLGFSGFVLGRTYREREDFLRGAAHSRTLRSA